MTSLGRLIFFDQPGTGASDPVTPGALPTLEQWADSITAVLDDLGSREAVDGAVATGAMFAATYPSRTTALVVLEGYAEPFAERPNAMDTQEARAAMVAMWGTGEYHHLLNLESRSARPDVRDAQHLRHSITPRGMLSPGHAAETMIDARSRRVTIQARLWRRPPVSTTTTTATRRTCLKNTCAC
jgi:pimeloyl-ACP methyl ester carboxylesterase